MFVKRSPRILKVKVAGALVRTRSHILVLVFAATRKERRSGMSTVQFTRRYDKHQINGYAYRP